jgi:hypothetical protein
VVQRFRTADYDPECDALFRSERDQRIDRCGATRRHERCRQARNENYQKCRGDHRRVPRLNVEQQLRELAAQRQPGRFKGMRVDTQAMRSITPERAGG